MLSRRHPSPTPRCGREGRSGPISCHSHRDTPVLPVPRAIQGQYEGPGATEGGQRAQVLPWARLGGVPEPQPLPGQRPVPGPPGPSREPPSSRRGCLLSADVLTACRQGPPQIGTWGGGWSWGPFPPGTAGDSSALGNKAPRKGETWGKGTAPQSPQVPLRPAGDFVQTPVHGGWGALGLCQRLCCAQRPLPQTALCRLPPSTPFCFSSFPT